MASALQWAVALAQCTSSFALMLWCLIPCCLIVLSTAVAGAPPPSTFCSAVVARIVDLLHRCFSGPILCSIEFGVSYWCFLCTLNHSFIVLPIQLYALVRSGWAPGSFRVVYVSSWFFRVVCVSFGFFRIVCMSFRFFRVVCVSSWFFPSCLCERVFWKWIFPFSEMIE